MKRQQKKIPRIKGIVSREAVILLLTLAIAFVIIVQQTSTASSLLDDATQSIKDIFSQNIFSSEIFSFNSIPSITGASITETSITGTNTIKDESIERDSVENSIAPASPASSISPASISDIISSGLIGIQNSGNSSQCGGLNRSITLTRNVSSTNTCFVVNVSNIFIDCQGFEINYSSGGLSGHGINNSGFDNITIRNCVIREGASDGSGSFKNAIYFLNDAANGTIYNNTIVLNGDTNAGIWLLGANSTNLSYNSITASSDINSVGIVFEHTSLSIVYANTITARGDSSEGITLSVGMNTANIIDSNRITARFGGALRIANDSYANIFINNNLTSEVNFSIVDDSNASSFNRLIYNNSFVELSWNLSNLTTDINLTLGVTVFLENNSVGIVEDPTLLRLNDTAQLRFYNLLHDSTAPTIIRNRNQCDNANTCNRTSYNLPTGLLEATVSTFSGNYSTEGCENDLGGNKTLQANVTTGGTCFTITGSNLVLNCAGYRINFSSNGSSGSGITLSSTRSNVTIRDCIIIEGNNISTSNVAVSFTASNNNGTIYNNTITVQGTNANGISLFTSNSTNVSGNTFLVRSNAQAISLTTAAYNSIYFNRIHIFEFGGTSSLGISMASPTLSNVFIANNITVEGEGTAVSIGTDSHQNNIFINNTIFVAGGYSISDSGTTSENRTLLYDGNFGSINWTSGNLTTNLSLIVGTTIFIENGTLGVLDSGFMGQLNRTAKLTFRGLPYSSTPQLWRAGARCDDTIFCNITYNASTGILLANVSSFSNYTVVRAPVPIVVVTAPANGSNISSADPYFNASIQDEAIDTVIFVFDNSSGQDFNNTPMNTSGNWNSHPGLDAFVEGLHQFTVFANNTANLINYTESVYFTIDRTPPAVNAFLLNTTQNASNFTRGTIQINATLNDSLSTVQVVLFGLTNDKNNTQFNISTYRAGSFWTANLSLSPLMDGLYTITVYGNDTFSNVNNSVSNLSFRVDNNAPNVTLFGMNASANNPALNRGALQFNVTVNDTITTVQNVFFGLRNDKNGSSFNITASATAGIWQATLPLSGLLDGNYSLSVFANDSLGNANNSAANLSFMLDQTPPNITFFIMNISNASTVDGGVIQINASINDTITLVRTVLFGLASSQNGTQFNVSTTLQGSVWEADVVVARLADATYTITLYANDSQGNLNNSVANLTFTVSVPTGSLGSSNTGNGGGSSPTTRATTKNTEPVTEEPVPSQTTPEEQETPPVQGSEPVEIQEEPSVQGSGTRAAIAGRAFFGGLQEALSKYQVYAISAGAAILILIFVSGSIPLIRRAMPAPPVTIQKVEYPAEKLQLQPWKARASLPLDKEFTAISQRIEQLRVQDLPHLASIPSESAKIKTPSKILPQGVTKQEMLYQQELENLDHKIARTAIQVSGPMHIKSSLPVSGHSFEISWQERAKMDKKLQGIRKELASPSLGINQRINQGTSLPTSADKKAIRKVYEISRKLERSHLVPSNELADVEQKIARLKKEMGK